MSITSLTPFMKEVMSVLINDEDCIQKLIQLRLQKETAIYHLQCQMDVELTHKGELQALIDFLRAK